MDFLRDPILVSIFFYYVAISFADDSNFFCTDKDLSSVGAIVDNELYEIVGWLNSNRMFLNIDKTNFMMFKPKHKIVDDTCDRVFTLQKRVLRIIAGVDGRTPSKPVFDSLCILSISKIYEYNVSLFICKHHHRQ